MSSATTLAQYLTAPRVDNAVRSLVVQGGGMRGVYSMGALAALEERALTDTFDTVIGSSAGAINGAYLLAGQAKQAVDVYVEYLSNRDFINKWRIGKIVDIDYMVDDVLKKLSPLNVEAVRKAKPTLEVVLTDAVTGRPVILSAADPSIDIYELIRATAALPTLYNRKIRIGSGRYVDGGLADAVPLQYALDLGSTDVLAVITRSPTFRRLDDSMLMRRAIRLASISQGRAVRQILGREDKRFNDAMAVLSGEKIVEQVRTWTVWPSDIGRLVERTTSDKKILRDCAEMGREDMLRLLDSPI